MRKPSIRNDPIYRKEHCRIKRELLIALSRQNYDFSRSKGIIRVKIPKKRGAPYGNKNAVGNNGGGAPIGNANAYKHGFDSNLMYRFQMAKIEKMLIERDQWSYEALLYYREKVLSGEIQFNPLKR